jgi:hypothetical protein
VTGGYSGSNGRIEEIDGVVADPDRKVKDSTEYQYSDSYDKDFSTHYSPVRDLFNRILEHTSDMLTKAGTVRVIITQRPGSAAAGKGSSTGREF